MIIIKSKILIKILDNEIWLYKNNKLYKEKTNEIIKDNFIINYKTLEKELKNIIDKYKLSGLVIQNILNILINKLYSETNLYVLKTVLYNLGFSNYKLIYEEDLYNDLYKNILCIWNHNGIYIENDKEIYIDLYKKDNIKRIKHNTLVITHNKDILKRINKDIIIYEEIEVPVFKMINENI